MIEISQYLHRILSCWIITFFVFGCVPQTKQKPVVKKQEAVPEEGLLVNKSLGISSAKQLDGASVCLITGGKEEIMVSDYFKKNSMSYESVTTETNSESRAAYLAGRCDAIVVDSNANVSSNDKVLPFEWEVI